MRKYLVGLAMLFSVVSPSWAQVNPHVAWWAVGTFYLTPTEKGRVVFDTSAATKAECEEWLNSDMYKEELADLQKYVERTYKEGKFEGTVCMQAPARREPA
jgi:hypothetical protein